MTTNVELEVDASRLLQFDPAGVVLNQHQNARPFDPLFNFAKKLSHYVKIGKASKAKPPDDSTSIAMAEIEDKNDASALLQFDPAGVVLHHVGKRNILTKLADFASDLKHYVEIATQSPSSEAAATEAVPDQCESLHTETGGQSEDVVVNEDPPIQPDPVASTTLPPTTDTITTADGSVTTGQTSTVAIKQEEELDIENPPALTDRRNENDSEGEEAARNEDICNENKAQQHSTAPGEPRKPGDPRAPCMLDYDDHNDSDAMMFLPATNGPDDDVANRDNTGNEVAGDQHDGAATTPTPPAKVQNRGTTVQQSECGDENDFLHNLRRVQNHISPEVAHMPLAAAQTHFQPVQNRHPGMFLAPFHCFTGAVFGAPMVGAPAAAGVQVGLPTPLQVRTQNSMPTIHNGNSNITSLDEQNQSSNTNKRDNEVTPDQPKSKRRRVSKKKKSEEVKDEDLPPLPEAPKIEAPDGYKGTLNESQLERSVGLTRAVLNCHLDELGLNNMFGMGVVSGSNGHVSHLTFNSKWNELPYWKGHTLKFWLGEGKGRLTAMSPLDPANTPEHDPVPIFWAQPSSKKGGAICYYVGHFRCVSFDTTQKVMLKGERRQALVEFKLTEFKSEVAKKILDIANSAKLPNQNTSGQAAL